MLALRRVSSSKALQRRRCLESAVTNSYRGTSTVASFLHRKEGEENKSSLVKERNYLLHQASWKGGVSIEIANVQRNRRLLDETKKESFASAQRSFVSLSFESGIDDNAVALSVRHPGFSPSNSILRPAAFESAGLGRGGVLSPGRTSAERRGYRGWNHPRNNIPHSQQLAFFSTEPALKSDDNEKETKTTNEQEAAAGSYSGTRTTNRPIPSRTLGPTPVPTPPSAPPPEVNPLERLKETTPKSVIRKGMDLTISLFKTVLTFIIKLPGNLLFYATHPSETRKAWHRLRDAAKEEANHYWVGTKLLWAEVRTARKLLNKTLEGNSLTRRERKQLLRTVSDLFRLVPFSMFVLIPFMEFALPFALRLFPNMLPSTYQDSLKAEENMKRELKSRIAMASFFQETMEELAKEQKRKASKKKKELEEAGVDLDQEDLTIEAQKETAASMLQFLEKARNGEMVPPDVIIRYANYFKDDLTLDNMPRMQLINMCRYMGIQPYGSDAFLRFQLRHRIRVLKEDDQRILWEGINSLTKMELREACQERGMRSTGLSKEAYRRALQQWLDLSVNKDVPISLLIMSRSFFLQEEMFEKQPDDSSKSLSGLADAISGLDKEILNEVLLEVATKEEKLSDPDVRKIKLAVVTEQNELIRQEEEAREAAAKKKEAAEKERAEKEAAEEALKPAASPSTPAEATVLSTATEALASADASIPEAEKPIASSVETEAPEEPKAKEESNLSADEMDAISQLVSDDPVSKEREELERIKAAMKGDEEVEVVDMNADVASPVEEKTRVEQKIEEAAVESAPASSSEPIAGDEDRLAKDTLDKMDREAAAEAEAATKISLDAHKGAKSGEESESSEEAKEESVEDPVVARLKKRIESMVDKIEVQLSETKVKIGDKLHQLDKDKDGILTREEMADALQQVLKRKISFEEAMEIADEMDENHDGVFTVQEFIRWIDEHKLVTFVAEGRDADMDRVMESQSSNQPKEEVPEGVEKQD